MEAGPKEFTKLLLAIVRGLFDHGVSPAEVASAHNSLEVVAHTMSSTETIPEW